MNNGAWFVTGTDTGVGKTTAAAACLSVLATTGHKVVGMKPIVSGGVNRGDQIVYQDVEILKQCSNIKVSNELINPYAFVPAIAPHLAARDAHIEIDINQIISCFQHLRALADCVVIEGVGGWSVPIGRDQTMGDVAKALNCPVILVVGMRLGCLNHSILTANAIQSAGLSLVAWIANEIDPGFERFDDNLQELVDRINRPLLGIIPYQQRQPLNFSKIAGYLDLTSLLKV